MDTPSATDVFLFEGFRLDRRRGVLSRRDERGALVPLVVGSRALDILGVLVERPGELVLRAEIIDAVWPGTIVEDSNLNVQIAALRRVLDAGKAESCIQTIPGRGYRLIASVAPGGSETARDALPVGLDALGEPTAGRPFRAAPHLSIVVLPFANLGDDPAQQYFADGVTEDLTTNLSRLPSMFVISANSAFTYRNRKVDTRQVGRELGVRYVLEGSVQRSGGRVRVNAQLIGAETDFHLWADRFDQETSDLFLLQDEIARRIANALNIEMTAAEAARPAANPDALDWVLRGRAILHKPISAENYAEAINFFERALALDRQSIDAQLELAQILVSRTLDFPSSAAAGDIDRAEALADRALADAPRSPFAHSVKGTVLRGRGRSAEAVAEYEAVLALDPNAAKAWADLGRCRVYVGPVEAAIPLLEQAIRLSPRDPRLGFWCSRIGEAHMLQFHIDEAILWFEKAARAFPAWGGPRGCLAAAYALKGDRERAAAALAAARKLHGEGYWRSIAQRRAVTRFEAPAIRALAEATFYQGLRLAGMPEE